MISSIGILNGYAAPVFMKYFLSLASTLENSLIIFQFIYKNGQPKPTKKTKCNHCSKRVNQNAFVYCKNCTKFYHLSCSNTKSKDFPLPKDWHCNKCSLKCLPFSTITDDNLLLNLQGLSSENTERLSNLPSFSIQSLLDQLPGQNFSTDDFLSDSIESNITPRHSLLL